MAMVDHDPQQVFERAAVEAAHEAAGPLHAVGSALGLLRSMLDPDDEDGAAALRLAERQLRLAQLQIDRFGRLASGPDEPDRRPCDLAELARELVDDLSTNLLADHPTSVEAPPAVEAVLDADQIRGLLFNLLSNAAKYSPAGRNIVVGIQRLDGRLELRVRDQGAGVAPDDAQRLFRRYERGDVDANGVGLGLPLARDVARAHGGELRIEPVEGEGSTFLLTLPRAS